MNFTTGWRPTTLTQNFKLSRIRLGSQLNNLIVSIKGIYGIGESGHLAIGTSVYRGANIPMTRFPDIPMAGASSWPPSLHYNGPDATKPTRFSAEAPE